MKVNIIKRIILLTMVVTSITCTAIENNITVTYYQNEKLMICTLDKNSQNICVMLVEYLEKMKNADREMKEFSKKKGGERKKEDFWTIHEIVNNNDSTEFIRADFLSQTGPLHMGIKRTYKNRELIAENAVRNKGYDIYYLKNSNVSKFLTQGKKHAILEFFPSGKLKVFSIEEKDGDWFYVEWDENGKVIENYSKPKSLSSAGNKPTS